MSQVSEKIVRPTEASVRARLAETGMNVPEECFSGTLANLIVLQDHMRTVRNFTLDDYHRVALKFEP
jgi:hypothetical protein